MQINIDQQTAYLNCLVWFEPDDPIGTRSDMAFINIDFEQQCLKGIRFEDVGELVPQPSSFKLGAPESFEQFFQHHEDAELLAKLFALACLSQITNLTLSVSDSSQAVSITELEHFGLGGSYNNLESTIIVPQDVVQFGIDWGWLEKKSVKNGLIPIISGGFIFTNDVSALDTVELMLTYQQKFGARFTSPVEKIDCDVARELLALFPIPSAKAVSYYGNVDHPGHYSRMQAARTYPLLAEYFLQFSQVIEAIDNQKELAPLIQSLAGINRGTLKRISKFKETEKPPEGIDFEEDINHGLVINRTRRFNLNQSMDAHFIIKTLPEIETNQIPNSNAEWQYYSNILFACFLPIESQLGIPVSELAKSSKGNWKRFYSTISKSVQIPIEGFHFDHLNTATEDAFEAIDSFMRGIFLPHLLISIRQLDGELPAPDSTIIQNAYNESYQLLRGNSTNIITFLINLGRRWVNRLPSLRVIRNPNAEQTNKEALQATKILLKKYKNSWPKLADDFSSKNNFIVRNLSTREQFLEESRRLNHCLGSHYVRDARRGKSHIFSIQSIDGKKSYSTFEISPPHPKLITSNVRLRQHKGNKNAKPNKKCSETLNEWLNNFRQGKLKTNFEEVFKWQEIHSLKRTVDDHRLNTPISPEIDWNYQLGKNWDNLEICNQTLDEWERYIIRTKLTELKDTHKLRRKVFAHTDSPGN